MDTVFQSDENYEYNASINGLNNLLSNPQIEVKSLIQLYFRLKRNKYQHLYDY